ncbi:MAG TPA: DUF1146 domain-containing protein [Acholeplasmataceae bacterium]|jgi:uncharacterized integral membrane protein (TIGR02327 family)|nr:DUF1146 domain-containing protein [Acholeplasmataceae bacterium]
MTDSFYTIIYFIIFFPLIYLLYNCFKAFDYGKILRRGKVGELKVILICLSIALSYLVSSAIMSVIERLAKFFV